MPYYGAMTADTVESSAPSATLSQVRRDAAGVVASVSLNSTPNQSFRLRYCYVATPDSSGNGECDQPIVGVLQTVSTDASGNFSGTTPVQVA